MKAHEWFDIDLQQKELICFVGAGGKTTTLFKLAKELKSLGKKVFVTTSTAIYYPEKNEYDLLLVNPGPEVVKNIEAVNTGTITIIGRAVSKENKLLGLDKEAIETLYRMQCFDYILVEADGSRQKTIKAPAFHEPVIPDNTDKTIGIMGLDAIGMPIHAENVHRPERFCSVTDSEMGEIITTEKLSRLIVHEQGLFKTIPAGCKRYVLLNKVENEARERSAWMIKDSIMNSGFDVAGIIAASVIREKTFYKWSDQS